MALIVKHFAELLGSKFNIPSYQRGYRWERKQVEDLLQDLTDYYDSPGSGKSFYCLQPIVVTKNHTLSSVDDIVYDLIDGQQRLTTLKLIYEVIFKEEMLPEGFDKEPYAITYERKETPIDDFFIDKAKDVINAWFKSRGKKLMSSISEVLFPNDIIKKLDKKEEYPDNSYDVRVIWYDLDEVTLSLYGKNMSPIEIFDRLNHGKTQLTSTELVKALLLQCDIYPHEERDVRRQLSFSRAYEWDVMEKQLQNPLMWGMLGDMDYESHLELLLSFVVKRILTNNPEVSDRIDLKSKDCNYRILNNYIYREGNEIKYVKKNIDYLWKTIQDSFIVLSNWYNNRIWYHLIGLRITLLRITEKDKDAQSAKLYDLLLETYQSYTSGVKKDFSRYLKQKIGEKVKINTKLSENSIIVKYKGGEKGKLYKLDEVNYHDCPKDLIRILLLYNVDITMNALNSSDLFPFHLFLRCKTTSLEHIHPQSLNIDEIEFNDLIDWYSRKKEEIVRLKKEDEFRESIEVLDMAIDNMEKDNEWFKDERKKKQCMNAVSKIDTLFNELAKIDETIMHTICNMALVDKDTNSKLQNYLLDKKRELLRKRESDNPEAPVFVPLGTKRVFSKYFNPSPDEMHFWTDVDRTNYYADIERVYNEYTK